MTIARLERGVIPALRNDLRRRSRGTSFVYLPYATNTIGVPVGGRPEFGAFGVAHRTTSATNAFVRLYSRAPARGAVSFVALVKFNNFSGTTFGQTASGGTLISNRAASGDVSFDVIVSSRGFASESTSIRRLWAGCASESVAQGRSFGLGAIELGYWYALAATYDGSGGRGGITCFLNGVADSTAYSTAGTFQDAWTCSGASSLCHSDLQANDADMELAFAARLDYALSMREALYYTSRPERVFELARDDILFSISAGGYTHPTLSTVTATEITATSFKPRVTYTF